MWELEDVIKVAQTCIILRNLIVHTQQNCDFRDESGVQDLIT